MKIYIANTRFAKTWRLWEVDWSLFTERLEKPIRTSETFAEYKALGKLKQSQIKDVGGFVGGVLLNGVRSASTVIERWLITLDADSPTPGFIETCFKNLNFDFCIYSTHSHAPENNRYRLIIPVDRAMTPDEYEAVARRIASYIGIDNFDDSTYEPSRLMYWPSCSRDAHYVFEEQDFMGPCKVDDVLSTYTDWRDCTQWPISSRVASIHIKQAKQADPLGKKGIIGAFCKAYGMKEAINTFLSDIYESTGNSNRWTYKKGSSFGGLVIYDDKFAFSNHGTDPASGKLCNAFDLVRIHKFGDLDSGASSETPVNRLPSFISMSDFASGLGKVKENVVKEAFAGVEESGLLVNPPNPPLRSKGGMGDTNPLQSGGMGDTNPLQSGGETGSKSQTLYAETVNPPTPLYAVRGASSSKTQQDFSWASELEIDKAGNIKNTAYNVKTILKNDINLKSIVYKDAFAEKLRLLECPPWREFLVGDNETWQDCDDAGLRVYMERTYNITQSRKIEDGFSVWTEEGKRHPVREYLDSLIWDGVARLDTLLIDYLGAYDTPYTRAVTRKSFVAAVTRIYKPGAKFDSMLVLVGPQGIGKSTMIKTMGGKWHTDSLTSVQGKDGPEQILGFWLVEMGELTAMKRAEETSVKQFLSKREDSFRPAYARHTRIFPRQCVFFGTTNVDTFLKDATGNRRFWVVVCNEYLPTKDVFNIDDKTRDLIWAEAKEYFRKKEPLFLSKELEKEAHKIQEAHREESPYAGAIRKYLNMMVPIGFETWETPNKIIYFNSYEEEGEELVNPPTPLYTVRGAQDSPDSKGGITEIDPPLSPLHKGGMGESETLHKGGMGEPLQSGGGGESPTQLEPIKRVCALMLWVEALGGNPANLDKLKAKEINEIVRNTEGWRATPGIHFNGIYGTQRGFRKI